jgi:uncharacterized YkwD family protein
VNWNKTAAHRVDFVQRFRITFYREKNLLFRKHYVDLIFFIGISLLPSLILYSSVVYPVREASDNLNGDIQTVEPALFESVNIYNLIFEQKKDPAVGLEGKARFIAKSQPEQQPEPEPEPNPQPAIVSGHQSASTRQKEQQMVNFINEARRSAGLSTLQVNNQLTTAARAKSKDMAINNYFDHHSPTYGSMTGLLSSFGISYRLAGENLAMNSSGSVYEAHNMLMNSPGHRSNILNPHFNIVGVGIHVRSDGIHYYTQLYVGY